MCSTSEAVCVSNLLSAGRENVTVSPVYRRAVTSWRCVRLVSARVRLAWAWDRSWTCGAAWGVAYVRSGAGARMGGGPDVGPK